MAAVKHSNPNAFKNLEVNLAQLGNSEAKVGWFENAKYSDGTPVAYIASIQEFGYPEGNIPPRLGMRFTAASRKRNGGQNLKSYPDGCSMGKCPATTPWRPLPCSQRLTLSNIYRATHRMRLSSLPRWPIRHRPRSAVKQNF